MKSPTPSTMLSKGSNKKKAFSSKSRPNFRRVTLLVLLHRDVFFLFSYKNILPCVWFLIFLYFFLFFDNKMCAEASSGTHSSVATQKGMKRWSCGAETPLKNTKSRLSSRWLRHLIQSTRDLVKSIPLMINTLFFFLFFLHLNIIFLIQFYQNTIPWFYCS